MVDQNDDRNGEIEAKSPASIVANITTSIFSADIPEEARQAILALIEEIDALRVEIKTNNARIAELEDLADSDPLTPVVNRRAFVREIDRARAYVERYGGSACLIYLDINGLKAINDGHGHAVGDQVLLAVANLLVDNVRSSDMVGRLGGDEFGVLIARADLKGAGEKAKALSGLIDALRVPAGDDALSVSAAFGIAEITTKSDAKTSITEADAAMYADKARKRAS
jgi:diguanylate cyclase (GGDEF)-like protein